MGVVINGSLVKGKSGFGGEVGVIPQLPPAKERKVRSKAREQLVNHMAAVAVSTIAIINPSVFVLTGQLATPDLHDPVRERCLELIEEKHLPRFVVRQEYEEDSFSGMTVMALNSLANKVRLVMKKIRRKKAAMQFTRASSLVVYSYPKDARPPRQNQTILSYL